MNILIFGGAGFIGTQLTRKYLDLGHHVTVVDDCSNALESEIYIHQTYAKFSYIGNKIENILEIKFPKYSYDIIYHLASESRPLKFSEKYSKIISSNVYGLEQLLIWMERFSPNAKLIYASSSEVYGNNSSELTEESPSTLEIKYPRNIYATSKMLAESILQNRSDIDWNIVRFFNIYGPKNRFDDTKIIPMLIKAIKNKSVFEICGHGSQTRSYTYIDDLIEGLLKISSANHAHEVFNLGRDEAHSVEEIVYSILERYPDFKYRHGVHRDGEPVHRSVNSSKAKEMLNWEPKYSLQNGLEKIFKYHGIVK